MTEPWTRTPPTCCPYCGFKLRTASHVSLSIRPNPGDPVICTSCAELLVFADDLRPVKPTQPQLIGLQANPVWREIELTQRAVKAAHQAIARGELPPLSQDPYELLDDGRAIKCLICGKVSHNPNDVAQLYCGNCHRFHEDT